MSKDPYFDVKHDVETALNSLHRLHAEYTRSHSSQALTEVKGTLASLEIDLEDLEESVRVVEDAGDFFGMPEQEITARRAFVRRVKADVLRMRESLRATTPTPPQKPRPSNNAYRDEEEALNGLEPDDVDSWEREEQISLMRGQDRTLDSISGTINTLHGQASLMGREVGEQNVMLEGLEMDVDATENKLNKAMKRMQDFVEKSEAKGSGWCIGILTIVLVILLLAVILL